MRVIKNINITDKKDIVNASNTSEMFKNYKEQTITMAGALFCESLNDKGETCRSIVVKTEDGRFIASGSPTLYDSLETICEVFDDEINAGEKIKLTVKTNRSNAGREFLTFLC